MDGTGRATALGRIARKAGTHARFRYSGNVNGVAAQRTRYRVPLGGTRTRRGSVWLSGAQRTKGIDSFSDGRRSETHAQRDASRRPHAIFWRNARGSYAETSRRAFTGRVEGIARVARLSAGERRALHDPALRDHLSGDDCRRGARAYSQGWAQKRNTERGVHPG